MADVLSQSELFACCGPSRSTAPLRQLRGTPPSARLRSEFRGRKLVIGGRTGELTWGCSRFLPVKMVLSIGKSLKWWEKELQPNMKEIQSAQDLVDSVLNAGNKLVIVGFFSPGCGGCKALHPKICQFAEMNPDGFFLQINYEKHKSMCYTLNVHVLPFFRFYRGANGRLCSFSCTNATIKKFKDALAKHSTERCSLGPSRGLEELELLALSANKDLSFIYTAKESPAADPDGVVEPAPPSSPFLPPVPASDGANVSEDISLVAAGRS